ncbi:MAG: hypothetical protein PHH04_00185 [Thomasclavelia sp.]|jgi:hypothetical protein|nr:hypothetical protein [Thomasclavelia sp.]
MKKNIFGVSKKLLSLMVCLALGFSLCLGVSFTKVSASSSTQEFVTNMNSLEQIADTYTGKVSGSYTGANKYQWLCFMFIRQFNGSYTSSNWEIAGGKVNTGFVSYVKSQNPTLYTYFQNLSSVENADVKHMAATVTANMHKNTGSYILAMRGYQWNDLSGWAGDLQTFTMFMKNSTPAGQSADYYASQTKTYMGQAVSTYGLDDLYADVDAVNIANMIASGQSLSTALTNYYTNRGVDKRITTFINGKNRDGLIAMAKPYTTLKYRTPIGFKTKWTLYKNISSIETNLTNGIASGYADYLLSLAAHE